jgi:hypothetical protein
MTAKHRTRTRVYIDLEPGTLAELGVSEDMAKRWQALG